VRRIIPLLLLAFGALVAQTPAGVVQFGALYCAAVQRAPTLVQTYCYLYPPAPAWTIVHNTIDTLPASGGSLIVNYNWPLTGDIIDWKFTLTGTALNWDYTANRGPIQSGIFGPLASASCVQTLCMVALGAPLAADLTVPVVAYPNGVIGPPMLTISAGSLTARFVVAFVNGPVALNPSVTNWAYGLLEGDYFMLGANPVVLYSGPHFEPTVWLGREG
jgi:hypothetical protein